MDDPIVKPMPFLEAVDKWMPRALAAANLTSAQWKLVAIDIKQRAFFASRVTNAQWLQSSKNFLTDYLTAAREVLPNGEIALKAGSRAQFVVDMQEKARQMGIGQLGKTAITNVQNESRLKLIFDVNQKSAYDFANYKQGIDPDVLEAFPAQKFIRVGHVEEPRPWHEENIGTIRRKDDTAFWVSMNRDFNVPWGPWGYNSQMDVLDVDRDTAEAMGLVQPGERLQPPPVAFNNDLQAGIQDMDVDTATELQRSLSGAASIDLQAGTITWLGK
jgi:hypothetical protein